MIKQGLFQQHATNILIWRSDAFPISHPTFDFVEEVKIKKNDHFYDALISVHGQYMQREKNNKSKWLSYENCQMTSVKQNIEGQQLHGIKLIYQEEVLEFYGDVELLQNFMKPFVIQTDFQNKYALTKKLGKGNFAAVYSARCKASGNIFAAKVFEKQLLNNEVDIESLVKEISIMRMLNHEQLMRLFEVYETNNHICVIIEQMNGGTLHDFFNKNSPLTEAHAAKLIYSLLKPIYYLHKLNIMHRDLKPENIIFRESTNFDQLCIADFGLAEIYASENPHYLFTRCGTPGFVAPEVLHDKNYNCLVDIYSVGVILYGALTGYYPFEGNYSTKVLKNYQGQVDFENIKISKSGMELLQSLLEFNPEERLTAQEALNHQWFRDEKITKQFEFRVRHSVQPLHQLVKMHSPQLEKRQLLSVTSQGSSGSPNSFTKSNGHNPLFKYSPFQPILTKEKLSAEQLDEQQSNNTPKNSNKLAPLSCTRNVKQVKQSLFKSIKP